MHVIFTNGPDLTWPDLRSDVYRFHPVYIYQVLNFSKYEFGYTGWFTRNNEPDGIENATRNSSGEKPGHLPLRCPAFCCNVLWVAFSVPSGSLFLVNHPVCNLNPKIHTCSCVYTSIDNQARKKKLLHSNTRMKNNKKCTYTRTEVVLS
jgi:hypothetical protein